MNELRVIAITHKNFTLDEIGKFHIQPEQRLAALQSLKEKFNLSEIMYLSTCNRVEIIFAQNHYVCPGQTTNLLSALHPQLESAFIIESAHKAERYNGIESVEHLLRVASSLESLVIGEREIITQLRKSYEDCAAENLTGELIRLVISQCVKTAKEIFTHTDLSKKPVSIVSLAWQQFKTKEMATDARILLIGAGQIIRNFSKFLFENGYTNVTIANRSLHNAEALAKAFGFKGIALESLATYTGGFDTLVSCTASENVVVSPALYQRINLGENQRKMVIDLAIPADIDAEIMNQFEVEYVDMKLIQNLASTNIQYREQALTDCEPIIDAGIREFERHFNERKIEMAMKSIPDAIKDIRSTAMGNVFAKDLEKLDDDSKELLEKIIGYMEKKYISIPMKMAREVLLDAVSKN